MTCASTPVCLPLVRLSRSRRRPSRLRQDRLTPIAPLVVSTGNSERCAISQTYTFDTDCPIGGVHRSSVVCHLQTAMTVSSPRIRTDTVPEHRLIVPCPPSRRALSCCADVPQGGRPCLRCLFVGSQICSRRPSDMFSRKYPCLTLVVCATVSAAVTQRQGTFTP